MGTIKENVNNNTNDNETQILSVDNHIYFYSEVERCKMLELNKQLSELDIKLQTNSLKLDTDLPKIYLHINSYGGSIFAGLSTLDTIRNTKCDVVTDDMDNNTKLMEMIKKLYKEYTKVPEDKLEEILKHDLWWDAETCLEYGLIDKILN